MRKIPPPLIPPLDGHAPEPEDEIDHWKAVDTNSNICLHALKFVEITEVMFVGLFNAIFWSINCWTLSPFCPQKRDE